MPRDRAFDDRSPPGDLMSESQDEKTELVNEWRETRALAQRSAAASKSAREVRHLAARRRRSRLRRAPGVRAKENKL